MSMHRLWQYPERTARRANGLGTAGGDAHAGLCLVTPRGHHRIPLVAGILAAVVLLASCDTVNPTDNIILPEKTVSFRFEIGPDGISPGETITVEAEDPVDLGSALNADGFTKAEVLSATVTRVELERVSPAGVDLSILEEAEVALVASGVSSRTIASSSSLPDDPATTLSISGSSDATSFVTASSFEGVLTIVPAVVPQGLLVMRATVSLRVEVEGV